MAKQTLQAVTPVGTFTRTTASAYKFVTVWASPRAKAAAENIARDPTAYRGGVHGRFAKDNGFGVTWHYTRPTPRAFQWDAGAALVGVFPVAGTEWEPVADPDAWKAADDAVIAAHRARKAAK